MLRRLVAVTGAALLAALAVPTPAQATHSWGAYHWARTTPSFTLQLGNNVGSDWRDYLRTTSADWTESTVVDTQVAGGNTKPRQCRPTAGRVEVCSAEYGNTGWLGIAQIWASGSHITQGTVKVNDTYYKTATYNTPAWRNYVMCQEVGHTLGLAHQDEVFDNLNLGSCMDYTNNPDSNQHPNAHDYEQLETIYAHPDSTSTVAAATATGAGSSRGSLDSRKSWGRPLEADHEGRSHVFARDLGAGTTVFTFVIWA